MLETVPEVECVCDTYGLYKISMVRIVCNTEQTDELPNVRVYTRNI